LALAVGEALINCYSARNRELVVVAEKEGLLKAN